MVLQLQAIKSRDWCEAAGTISLIRKETEGSGSNGSDNSSDNINLDLSRTPPVLNSPVSSQNDKSLLPKPNSISQLLQYTSSRPGLRDDQGFCNMFHNIDEQHNFWPWPEQNHLH